MADVRVEVVTPQVQFPLREQVLGQPPTFKDGDEARTTLHIGVYRGDQLVSIASIYHENHPERPSGNDWRLRGVATLPEFEGQGFGRKAVQRCIDHARAMGGTVVWCNARENAVPFYIRLGFSVKPDSYALPNGGIRYFMWLSLQ
ncbi:MAG: GNAT family N-acetyltransferase [bacterium]|nr:GNAT family N-acetyltransferase [bacterium]